MSVVQREPEVSATVSDWQREQKEFWDWNPGKSLLASIRSYQRHAASGGMFSAAFKKLAVIRHRFWSVVAGADIPINTQIGGGLLLPHPNGIVIHPNVSIGPNCLIFQQVTLGDRKGGTPTVAGHVDIGAGAKVLGRLTLGPHSKVAANAVVMKDVPAHATAVGVPARILGLGHVTEQEEQ